MSKKICLECIYRILNVEDAVEVLESPFQWQCRAGWWQDISVCLQCTHSIHDWAERCKNFEKIKGD